MRHYFGLGVLVLALALGAAMGTPAHAQDGPDGHTAYSLNLRTGPGVEYETVITLRPNSGLAFEGRNADASWLLARTTDGALRGWVASLYVTFRDGFSVAGLPLSAETVAAYQVPAQPTPVMAQAGPPPAPSGSGAITSTANIRRGPDSYHPVLGQLEAGTPVLLEAQSAAGDWLLVRSGDGSLRGWVAGWLVEAGEGGVLPVSDEIMFLAEPPGMARLRGAPIVAQATATARAIYQRGLERGNNPARFSKVGDCQSVPEFFLAAFDEGAYDLGAEYAYLQGAIDHFAGSFARESIAVWSGFNVYAVTDPTWAPPGVCQAGESPIACEYRLWQPSFVIISLEVWHGDPPTYVENLRQVIEFWISRDVVPILGTKADNREGNWEINTAIAELAWEYDIPLWNFLMAAQPLRDFGLTDGFHLSYAGNRFNDPQAMQNAWPWRNLTALQSLDSVWRGVAG